MILIVTNKKDITADYLIGELKRIGYEYIRFNTEDFPQKITLHWEPNNYDESYIIFPKLKLKLNNIRSIWYRRPVNAIPHKEIEDSDSRKFIIQESKETLDGVFESLNCFWMSKPSCIRRAENKLLQLTIASHFGLAIPKTIITNIPDSFEAFYRNNELVNKPIKGGRVENDDSVKLIYTNVINPGESRKLNLIKFCPTLFQEKISKKVDVRLTIIGQEVFGVAINSQKDEKTKIDWRRGIEGKLSYSILQVPDYIREKCFEVMRYFNISFSAMDFILTTEGEYIFLELNPNGQWAWIQEITGLPMSKCMSDVLHKGKY